MHSVRPRETPDSAERYPSGDQMTVIMPRPEASTGTRRGRMTLAAQTALVTTGVVALAALLVGLISFGQVRGAAERQARATLARQADLAQTELDQRGANENPQILDKLRAVALLRR